jgi:hypothetical protein
MAGYCGTERVDSEYGLVMVALAHYRLRHSLSGFSFEASFSDE